MRKSLADERKIRHSKRKDKKNKSKFEKNPLCLMRLSQGYEQLQSPRLSLIRSPKLSSCLKGKENGNRNINSKNLPKRNLSYLSGATSPYKTPFMEKCNNLFSTTNCTPMRKSYRDDCLKNEGKNMRKNYKFIYQIGFGGFGRVWKVQQKRTLKEFAMKQISKRKVIEKNSVECIMNEKTVLSGLDCQFLINISHTFQDENNLYLVMDYLRGADLRYHICYKEKFTELETKFIIACILMSLEYIHQKKVIHRDIKPENLVFEENGYLRLTDFGVAIMASNLNQARNDSSGTPGYMSPEIAFRREYSYSSDFFAVGVIGYELMLGRRPYLGKTRKQIRQLLEQTQVQIASQEIPDKWSPHSADFFNKLLMIDPHCRLGSKEGVRELKKHKWMKTLDWSKLQKKQLLPPFAPHIVCQTKDYLDQIILYNDLNSNTENDDHKSIRAEQQKLFDGYNFSKQPKEQQRRTNKKTRKHSQQSKY